MKEECALQVMAARLASHLLPDFALGHIVVNDVTSDEVRQFIPTEVRQSKLLLDSQSIGTEVRQSILRLDSPY